MSCPSEEIWAAHADDECPRAERPALEAHLATCAGCRDLVRALREENQLLARVLGDVPQPEPTRFAAFPVWGGALAALAAVALGWHVASDALAGLGSESPAALVDERRVILGLLFQAVSYMLREGASMLESILTTFVLPLLVVLGGLVAFSLRRRWAGGTLALALLLAGPGRSSAITNRDAGSGHERVLVASGETLDDSLVAHGQTVAVDGTVSGNLFAAASRLIVRGTIKGDLMAVAERIEIEGTVEGNIFAAGDTLVIRGAVGQSMYGGGTTLRIEEPGRVEGDLIGAAEDLDLRGRVGRDLVAFAGDSNVRGSVDRDVSVRARRLHLDAPARVGGNLVARVPDASGVQLEPGAVVSGKTETRIQPKEKSRYERAGFYVWRMIWLVAAFLTGLLLHALFPALFPARVPASLALLRAAGLGFVALVAVPAAAALLMLTLIGLPLGLIVLALWFAGLYVAQILVGTLVGRALLEKAGAPPASFAPVLLVGLVCVVFASNLPFVDGLVRLVVLVLGLGLAVVGVYRRGRVVAEA